MNIIYVQSQLIPVYMECWESFSSWYQELTFACVVKAHKSPLNYVAASSFVQGHSPTLPFPSLDFSKFISTTSASQTEGTLEQIRVRLAGSASATLLPSSNQDQVPLAGTSLPGGLCLLPLLSTGEEPASLSVHGLNASCFPQSGTWL